MTHIREELYQTQKRIVAVHDLSGLGKCSLTVALPIISATGIECACIPTALLSTHTGGFEGFTRLDLSDEMEKIARHWNSLSLHVDGIYSGYLASSEQERQLQTILDLLAHENTKIIVDPVMADHGKYYHSFDDTMCDSFRRLCRRAHVITPNITEAAFLTGLEYRDPPHSLQYIETLLDLLLDMGPKIVTLTGVQQSSTEIGVAAKSAEDKTFHFEKRVLYPGVFHGSGDIFASAFAALLIKEVPLGAALEIATDLVSESIERNLKRKTPRKYGVDFEGALGNYIQSIASKGF